MDDVTEPPTDGGSESKELNREVERLRRECTALTHACERAELACAILRQQLKETRERAARLQEPMAEHGVDDVATLVPPVQRSSAIRWAVERLRGVLRYP